MADLVLQFDAEVVDDQRLLNGTRYVVLEGIAEDQAGSWMLSLSFGQPKEEESPLQEADLVLTGPGGSLAAGLDSGLTEIAIDEVTGEQREALNITLGIAGSEGEQTGVQGTIRVRGELLRERGSLEVEVILDEPSPER